MHVASISSLTLAFFALAGCSKPVSQSDLRLEAKSENGRSWLVVQAPPEALPINDWIRQCTGNVEVIYQSPRVASFACREVTASRYASFRLRDGHHLRLADIIRRESEGEFREAANKAFRKRKTDPGPIPPDVALNAQGLVFYAAGQDVVIPQTELRPMVRPESAFLVGR